MSTIKIGVLETSMSGSIAEFFNEAREFLAKNLNVSEEFEMLSMHDVYSYNGTGSFEPECNLIMFPMSFTSTNHLTKFMLSTPVYDTNSVIVSGPPQNVLNVSMSRMIPVEANVFVTLTMVTLLVWSVNKLISKVIPSKVRANLRDNPKWLQLPTDLLRLNCPLIYRAIPGFNACKQASRILLSFWLVSQTFLSWYLGSYFSADASTIVYSKIDDLTDLNEHKDLKLKLLLDSTEHRFLKIQVERNSGQFKNLAKMLKNVISLEGMEDLLAEELYVGISEKDAVLVVNDMDLRCVSCYALSLATSGKFTLYYSTQSFLRTPLFFLLDRNVSSSVNEIINIKLGRIYESHAFDNIGLECDYIVYSKNVWEKPVDNEVRLNIWAFYYPALLLILLFSFATVISIYQVLFSLFGLIKLT